MHCNTQPAITVITSFALEPVATLVQVHRETVELFRLHLADVGHVDRVGTDSGDFRDV